MANDPLIRGTLQYTKVKPNYELSDTLKRIRELEKENPSLYGLVNGFDGWRARYLVALALRGTMAAACRTAGVSPTTVRKHILKDPKFEAAAREAAEIAIDDLEAVAFDLAAGAQGDKPDGAMLRFLLKTRRREVYGDKVEISTDQGGEVDPDIREGVERPAQLSEVLATLQQAGVVTDEQAEILDGEFRELPPGAEGDSNLYH